MNFAINIDTRKVVTWAGDQIDSFAITRGDSFLAKIRFIQGNGYVELPVASTARVAFKQKGLFSSAILAGQVSWNKTGVGAKSIYSMALDFNTIPIHALFASEPAALDLVMEFEWFDGVFVRQTATPVPVDLVNDYARNTDGLPVLALDLKATQAEAEDGTNNEHWMTPLRVTQAITKMASAIGVSWNLITGKPAVFPPDAHTHTAADVTDLSSTIDAKIAVVDAGIY